MPTYEYECVNCKKTFEIFQKMSDLPLDKCPKCHKKISRLIGAGSGIIFKGKGFYATDYRKHPDKGPASKLKPAACHTQGSGCASCPHSQ